MSTNASHAEHHGHGQDHVPHVLPLKTYLMTWGALIVLTVITVAVSYVDFGSPSVNLFVALLVAATKAALVSLVFMHLWFDNKINSIIFASALVFLAIFIAFTMFDTESRGVNDINGWDRPANYAEPFAGTVREAQTRALWTAPAEAPAAAAAAEDLPAMDAPAPKPEPAPAEAAPAAAEAPKAEEAPAEGEAPKAEEAPAEAAEPAAP